jgi:hypothetical protein
MLKQGGQWKTVDWQTALEVRGQRRVLPPRLPRKRASKHRFQGLSLMNRAPLPVRCWRRAQGDPAGQCCRSPWQGVQFTGIGKLDREPDRGVGRLSLRSGQYRRRSSGGRYPGEGGLDAGKMLAGGLKALILLNTEPEFDSAAGVNAKTALGSADMVVSLNPFKANMDFADVVLPVAPFTETSGSFVNAEWPTCHRCGIAQGLVGWTQMPPGPQPRRSPGSAEPIADAGEADGLQGDHPPDAPPTRACSSWARHDHHAGAGRLGRDALWPRVALANINAGLLFLMAITSLEVYGVIIAGWASNSKYAFLGALRPRRRWSATKSPWASALVVVLMVSASMNMTDIVMGQGKGSLPQMGLNSCPGTGCRCCRSSSSTSSPAWPKPTATRSTWSKANPRSWPATWSSTRACRSRCSSWPNTPT